MCAKGISCFQSVLKVQHVGQNLTPGNVIEMTRLPESCTPLLWPQLLLLPVFWTVVKLKINRKTKCSCCFCSYGILFIIVNLLHVMMIEWLNKIIQTTPCPRWAYKTTTVFSDNNRITFDKSNAWHVGLTWVRLLLMLFPLTGPLWISTLFLLSAWFQLS